MVEKDITNSPERYVIIDDFVYSGETIEKIRFEIDNIIWWNAKCVGVILYQTVTCRPLIDDIPTTCLGEDIPEIHNIRTEEEILV